MKRKIAFAALAIAGFLLASYGFATMIANYQWVNNGNVTASPGLTVYDTSTGAVITSVNWGDVQQTTSKSISVMVKNTQGTIDLWLIPTMSLQTSGLPGGMVLSWTLSQATDLPPGGTVQTQITLSATTSATMGPFSFTTTIQAFDSSSG